jgi:hypothetical protein
LEFLFNDKVLFAGNVDEPLVERIFRRLDTLQKNDFEKFFEEKKNNRIYRSNVFGFLPLVSITKPLGMTSLLNNQQINEKKE